MLDVSLDGVKLRVLAGVSLHFDRSAHTAVVGLPASGISTLLRVIAGVERPESGVVRIGTRDVTTMRASARPLLFATADLDVPDRWSVEHALVNAVRARSLDREDRHRELLLAIEKWRVDPRARTGSLSESERARVHLARIELSKPALMIADRLLRDLPSAADEWYRTLRVMGTTVISAPASVAELGMTDRVVVLDAGKIVQQGPAAEVYGAPRSVAAAVATGRVNVLPVEVRGVEATSPIGSWPVPDPPFQGTGKALVRPEAFSVAPKGAESDLIFGIEEASFESGRWLARGLLTGGLELRVYLPASERIFKGRVLALCFDSAAVTLIPG